MTLSGFLKKYKIEPVEKSNEWKHFRFKLAGLTKYIDYGCNFKNNTCRTGKSKGCCTSCQSNYRVSGYFIIDELINDKTFLTLLAELDHPKTGYWREGIGCILPREYRSKTCLNCRCENIHDRNRIRKEAKMLLELLKLHHKESSCVSKELIDTIEEILRNQGGY